MGIRILAIIVGLLLLAFVGSMVIDMDISAEMLLIVVVGFVFLAYGVGGPKLIERPIGGRNHRIPGHRDMRCNTDVCRQEIGLIYAIRSAW